MVPHLSISVSHNTTLIDYISDGTVLVTHLHPYGHKNIEDDGMGDMAASKLRDGVIYVLEFISLHDRIPTEFKVLSPKYSSWIKEALQKESYSQFWRNGFPINVTIDNIKQKEDNSFSYARHSKTIQSFKV